MNSTNLYFMIWIKKMILKKVIMIHTKHCPCACWTPNLDLIDILYNYDSFRIFVEFETASQTSQPMMTE